MKKAVFGIALGISLLFNTAVSYAQTALQNLRLDTPKLETPAQKNIILAYSQKDARNTIKRGDVCCYEAFDKAGEGFFITAVFTDPKKYAEYKEKFPDTKTADGGTRFQWNSRVSFEKYRIRQKGRIHKILTQRKEEAQNRTPNQKNAFFFRNNVHNLRR